MEATQPQLTCQSILVARRPTPEEVHQRNFGAIWEDIPSPLLSVNQQVRAGTLADYEISDMDETHFKRLTAQKARVKLDAITLDGLDKMSEVEWHALTEVWPHFETLTGWEEGGVFKGEWHYMMKMKRRTTLDSSAWVHTDAWMRRL